MEQNLNDKKKKKKNFALFILYGALTVGILCIFLGINDFGETMKVLGGADIKYVLIALALLALYAALTPLTTCMLTKAKGLNVGFGTTYSISMTEHFFNGITPFSTGGQPFQIYEFSRAKVKAADSTGTLLLNFIIMMIVTNAFAACSLIYYGRFIDGNVAMQVIAIVGFTMNALVLFFMISL
ncbi:MAG: lysylphosphatidylglycerol synthase domain-containing protein, partial [Candidatus Coproplasma sp.]